MLNMSAAGIERLVGVTVICLAVGCSGGSDGKGTSETVENTADLPGTELPSDVPPLPDSSTADLPVGPQDQLDCDQQVCFDCTCECSGDCGGCFSICGPIPPGVEDCSCCTPCPDVSDILDSELSEPDAQGPEDPPIPQGTCVEDADCTFLPPASCCDPPPYPCQHKPAIGNAADLEALDAWKLEACNPPPECPDYAKPACDTCYDLILYSPDCVEGLCVVAEKIDCDAVCAASSKSPEELCPFISDPDLITGDTLELCGCFIITECDPLAQTGCPPNEKCTLTGNKPDCKPNGFQPKNAPCNPDSDTCAAGLICNPLNWCAPICTEDYQCENEGYEFCNKTQLGPLYGYCMVYL